MTEEIKKNVISFLEKSKHIHCCDVNANILKSEDGYYYVCTKNDPQGNKYDYDALIEKASKYHYIVRVMRKEDGHVVIYNYNVPGENLESFLKPYILKETSSKIIEIEKHTPKGLA